MTSAHKEKEGDERGEQDDDERHDYGRDEDAVV
jgi:hypothetical protein